MIVDYNHNTRYTIGNLGGAAAMRGLNAQPNMKGYDT